MSKDFEKAYKELAEIEVPDLWGRIEAGLTEKSAPDKGSVIIDRSVTDEKTDTVKIKKKSKVTIFIKRYSSLAAAVLCLAIIVPALIFMKQSGMDKSSSDTAVAEEAYDAACETTEMTEEPAEMAEVTGSMAAADTTEETAGMVNAASAAAAPEAENAMCESAADEAWEETADEGGKETAGMDSLSDNAERKAAGSTQAAGMKADKAEDDLQEKLQSNEKKKPEEGQILSNVIVKVTEVDDYILEAQTAEEMGTLYTAIVQEEPSGFLTKGEEIAIFIPVYSSTALVKDGIFELDLAFCEKENYSFTVERYHEQIEE